MQQVGQEYKIFVLASNIVISPAFSSNLQGQMSRKVREPDLNCLQQQMVIYFEQIWTITYF